MKHLIYSLALLFLVSCSVQKRHYRKGFYVEGLGAKSATQVKKQSKPLFNTSTEAFVTPVEGRTSKAEESLISVKEKTVPTDSCDVLVFRDGTETLAKITEISEQQVRYKRCDNLEGPTYVTDKADLFMIKYGNGTREIMKAPAPKTTVINPAPVNDNSTDKKERYKYDEPASASIALVAGITAILGLIIGLFTIYALISSFFSGIKAIASARKYLKLTSQEPYAYPGRSKALAGLVLGIITMSVWLLIILVFILVLFSL